MRPHFLLTKCQLQTKLALVMGIIMAVKTKGERIKQENDMSVKLRNELCTRRYEMKPCVNFTT